MQLPVSLSSPERAVATERISAGGLQWSVETKGHGPPLLLMHGTGGTRQSWDALVPLLEPEFTLITLDLPGHGGTAFPGFAQMTLPRMATLVRLLLTALSVRPVGIISHSAGSAVMMQLAIAGAVPGETLLVGINPALRAQSAAARGVLQGPVGDLFRSGVARLMVRVAGQFTPMIELLLASTGSRLSTAQERQYVQAFGSPDHAEAAFAMMANWDLLAVDTALSSIVQRTLFVVGSKDPWIPPAVAFDAARRMPNARVVSIPNAGHLVHEECPLEVAKHILDAWRARPS